MEMQSMTHSSNIHLDASFTSTFFLGAFVKEQHGYEKHKCKAWGYKI